LDKQSQSRCVCVGKRLRLFVGSIMGGCSRSGIAASSISGMSKHKRPLNVTSFVLGGVRALMPAQNF